MNEIVLPADVVLFHVSPYDCWRTTYGGTSVTMDHIRTLRNHLDALERTLRPPARNEGFFSPVNCSWNPGDIIQVDPAYDNALPGALAVVMSTEAYHVMGYPLTQSSLTKHNDWIAWSKYHVRWCGILAWPRNLWRESQNSKQK